MIVTFLIILAACGVLCYGALHAYIAWNRERRIELRCDVMDALLRWRNEVDRVERAVRYVMQRHNADRESVETAVKAGLAWLDLSLDPRTFVHPEIPDARKRNPQ